MILRPFTVAAASQWLAELDTHPHEWWQSQDNILEVIRVTDFYRKLLSPLLLNRIYALLAKHTTINRARIEAIFKLRTVEDMQRAVRWPGAQPLDRTEAHTELYPTTGWLGEYLLYTQGSEIPMAWHFWLGVSIIGAACRRNLSLDMGTWRVFPYWYMMIIEETASAKSTAFGVACDMLNRAANQLEDANRTDRVVKIASQSGTLAGFLEQIKSEDFLTVMPDGTQIAGKTEASVVLPVDELVSLLGKTKHNPEEWISFLTDLFGNTRNEWRDTTVSRGARVLMRPAISFWAGTTLEWVKSSVTEDMFAGGFLGRFVFIKRKGDGKEVPRPHPLDPVWAESLAEFLTKLSLMDITEFTLTPEAWAWHDEWYHANKARTRRFQGDKFQAYFRRKQSHLLRLAMCLSISEGSFVADLATLKLAQEILAIEEEPMAWIFNDLGSHPDKALCDMILQVVERGRGVPVSYTEILRRMRYKVGSTDKLKPLIATLVQAGELIGERAPKGGGGVQYTLAKPIRDPDAEPKRYVKSTEYQLLSPSRADGEEKPE